MHDPLPVGPIYIEDRLLGWRVIKPVKAKRSEIRRDSRAQTRRIKVWVISSTMRLSGFTKCETGQEAEDRTDQGSNLSRTGQNAGLSNV